MKKLAANLKKIIHILNDGDFHAGSDLGDKLGITRTAVWKFIHQLTAYGIAIESVQGKGYRLMETLALLNTAHIKKYIKNSAYREQIKLDVLTTIDSTNDYLKNPPALQKAAKRPPFAKGVTNPITFCVAEQQTAGRGRLGRNWHSPFGANIYLSCAWRFNKDISELSGLSLVVGLAVINALTEYGIDKDIKIKWPNDILWQNKKLAGILIDINAESHGNAQAIIGIGLNINMSNYENKNISQPWCSLKEILGAHQDRNKIAGLLIEKLLDYLQQFEKLGLNSFLKEWQKYDALLGKTIHLENGHNIISGIADGISPQGHLLLKHPDGAMKSYSSGDVSIKK